MLSADAIFHNFITGKMTPFYDRYYPGLLMYARRVLLDSELEWMAEDCVQEAVMDAFQKRHIFNDPAQWHAHMLACIRNKAISARRRLSARRNYEENMSAGSDSRNPEPDMTHALIEHETLDALYAAIKSLPPNYRELLSMSFEECRDCGSARCERDHGEETQGTHDRNAALSTRRRNRPSHDCHTVERVPAENALTLKFNT